MRGRKILDEIRERCGEVARRAEHVRIVHGRMAACVASLQDAPCRVPGLDTISHFVGTEEETVAFFTTLAAVNFGSGYFPELRKRPDMSGYFTIASALTDHFRSHGPLSAAELAQMSARRCAELFGQDEGRPAAADLMGLFAQAWNDLGRQLLSGFGGSFSDCIAAAGHSAARLVTILAEQPFFRDVSRYHDIDVPFFKRAQLLASDLALALDGRGLGRFHDLHELTLFADNLVPHVLRMEGILEYSAPLLRAIETERLLPAGSDEEIEIRACCVHAVEQMIEIAREDGAAWTARDMDQALWHRGQDPRTKKQAKRHRTRTVFY
jgi:hypothetical protein